MKKLKSEAPKDHNMPPQSHELASHTLFLNEFPTKGNSSY